MKKIGSARFVPAVLVGLAASGVGATLRAAEPAAEAVEQRIVDGVNALRRAAGIQPVRRDDRLQAAARSFAAFMARNDRYGHDADGRQPVQRTRAAGYAECMVSENIAYQFSTGGFEEASLARDFVTGWHESPGHRRNMLAAEATETGVGVARAEGSPRYYAVQVFARPKALMERFAISNRAGRTVSYRLEDDEFALPPNTTRTHERCRRAPVLLNLPGRSEPERLQPADGDRWRVVQAAGHWRVEREQRHRSGRSR